MKNWKDNVYFVLVEPVEAGNIGAAARAIKNMGFKNLSLVNPPPDLGAAATLAHNAMDVLESASVCGSLGDSIMDLELVAGTTRRRGRRRGAFLPVESGARRLFEAAGANRVAVLFGREDRGLYNEETDECGFLMTIPADRGQPSINLAQSVMIIAYELSKAGFRSEKKEGGDGDAHMYTALPPRLVTRHELTLLYERMETALKLIEYIPPGNIFLNNKIMQNLKHFLGRAGLTDWEYNMFHGICKHIEKAVGDTGIRGTGKKH